MKKVNCSACRKLITKYLDFVCLSCKNNIYFCHSCYNVLYKTRWPKSSPELLPQNICSNLKCYEVYQTIPVE